MTGKTKKPTEIIVFTDGYSFSCTSFFIKGLQEHGHAIIVGYNSKPGLEKSDFDAAQSSSSVETFKYSEKVQNLNKLGFNVRVTFGAKFDHNDKGNPKTPEEFLIYPVDYISPLYISYDDQLYQTFITVSKNIFDKYNDLENGECNPDNKLLYYETSDCDSQLNIERAHGGYLCGKNGKWNKKKCIASLL